MSYHNISQTTSQQAQQPEGNIITYIDGVPLFKTIQQALDYGATVNLQGYHTHTFQNIVGYMAGFDHNNATNIESNVSYNINTFNFKQTNLTLTQATRQVKLTGDIGAKFNLQIVQKSLSSSVLDKFYNFTNKTFETSFNKNHVFKHTLTSTFFAKNIFFPSTSVAGYRLLLTTEEKTGTKIANNIVGSTENILTRDINQSGNVTVTFVYNTSNTSSFSSDPPASNVTSVGAPGGATSTVVDLSKTLTNATTDANGFGLSMPNGFNENTDVFITKTQTVNGAISPSDASIGRKVILDDISGIVVGSSVTAVSSGSLNTSSGSNLVMDVATATKEVVLKGSQTFADGITLTFTITGTSSINASTGFNATFAGLSAVTENIHGNTNETLSTGSKFDNTLKTTTTVRGDLSENAGPSGSLNVNGTYGISKGSKIIGEGFAPLESEVTAVSASSNQGSITTNAIEHGALSSGSALDFIGFSKTIDLSGANVTISNYPTEDLTVNINLDNFITPGTAS
tara:strand:- start:622 stop:2160 length:1539 start_codon:yes stop_codon:yes gene_type:complete